MACSYGLTLGSRTLDRVADAGNIGPATADISRHRCIDVGIIGIGVAASRAVADMIWPDWQ